MKHPFFLLLLFSQLLSSLRAEVKLPAIFSDHMVLQQDQKLTVWGKATPGEQVTISIGGKSASVTTGSDGKWLASLDPLPANALPQELKVEGTNTLIIKDVLIGEVWLCSGQSNMHWGVKFSHNAAQAVPTANHPGIRFFIVGRKVSFTPEEDCEGRWEICTPESIQLAANGASLSAVGYFFSKTLHTTRQVPVGLIESAWGGTPAQAWTRLEALAAKPELNHYVESFRKTQQELPQLLAQYNTETLPKWQTERNAWLKEHRKPFAEMLNKWKAEAETARQAGQVEPSKPTYPVPSPTQPISPDANPKLPCVLYNGMIAPIERYTLRGVLWYQGEANTTSEASCREYATLFPALITDWRSLWNEGDFPFLYVQLANFGGGKNWPLLRQSQVQTLALKNTGMAVAIDAGEEKDIHPKNKQIIGDRLFVAARHVAYGENLVYSGPLYDSMTKEETKVRIRFQHTGSGLVIGSGPVLRLNTPAPNPLDHLEGFVIAGADKKFVPALAKIDGDSVLVWSEQISAPENVRYAWEPFPKANLYNKEGLPASPFATDAP